MPTPSFLKEASFIESYNTFVHYYEYLLDWANAANDICTDLQADPNFESGLLPEEQAEVVTVQKAAVLLIQTLKPKDSK